MKVEIETQVVDVLDLVDEVGMRRVVMIEMTGVEGANEQVVS